MFCFIFQKARRWGGWHLRPHVRLCPPARHWRLRQVDGLPRLWEARWAAQRFWGQDQRSLCQRSWEDRCQLCQGRVPARRFRRWPQTARPLPAEIRSMPCQPPAVVQRQLVNRPRYDFERKNLVQYPTFSLKLPSPLPCPPDHPHPHPPPIHDPWYHWSYPHSELIQPMLKNSKLCFESRFFAHLKFSKDENLLIFCYRSCSCSANLLHTQMVAVDILSLLIIVLLIKNRKMTIPNVVVFSNQEDAFLKSILWNISKERKNIHRVKLLLGSDLPKRMRRSVYPRGY